MPPRKILFVDQDSYSLQFLEAEAHKRGYEAILENTGKDGLISAWRELPNILVIDPNLRDISAEDFLHKLRNDRRTANCIFIAFSSLSDPQAIQEAIDLEYNYYLTKESDAVEALFNAIEGKSTPPEKTEPDIVEQEAELLSTDLRHGKLVSFLSPKGGTGTSSICANFAAVLAAKEPEKRVAVVDMVLPIGSIAHIVGYDGPLNIVDAADMTAVESTKEYFKDHLPQLSTWRFQLLAGSPSPNLSDQLQISRVPIIINTLLEVFDYVLVDLGRSFSKINLPIILISDQVVLILSVDMDTAALAKTVLDYLVDKGLKEDQLFPIINRALGLEGMTKSEIQGKLGIEAIGTLPYAGQNFSLANNLNTPLHIKFPDSSISFEFQDIVQEMISRVSLLRERKHSAT